MKKESTLAKERILAEVIRFLSTDLAAQVIADLLQINRRVVLDIQKDPKYNIKCPLRLGTGFKRDRGVPKDGCFDYNNIKFF